MATAAAAARTLRGPLRQYPRSISTSLVPALISHHPTSARHYRRPSLPLLLPIITASPSTSPSPSQRRPLTRTSTMAMPVAETETDTEPIEPIFAAGLDRNQFLPPTQALLEEEQWTLDEERMGVYKTYYFKTYTKCLDFAQVIGIRSKSKNHHSTMTVKAGSVQVHWTTHKPRGLSDKDIFMAQYCDQQARLIGTVERSEANKCGPAPNKPKKEAGASASADVM